ncbi:hypothetical protein ASPZODRAFT_153067 [Penicilliopsis zonata CBS 506.65]|uniref:DNA replication complex GINS protein SLD5 n=1 Tax=Penicilliopsis zonata CBS 506.65 TaxID=1073090 RepID=A0A1L9SED8_9EURO|nr:hypothetical protein ASPZODRAFT_153067 [Penicilliopsis zonata CBS 506.65]OJJ45414.1 hypothetical protein ASPZODRAFT_153067 [Penicilliopsis zonata CBS 506.65]
MDIDDILASVDRHDDSPASAALDHQLLTRFWVAERAVSEVLPWPTLLMERMMERVSQQISRIEDLASSSSPTTNLHLSILQTDLARTQYLIRSLLRQRLSKLTKHSMYYLLKIAGANPVDSQPSQHHHNQQQPQDSVPDFPAGILGSNTSPLSNQEASFLHAHQKLLAGHFGASFLSGFPAQLRRLDDNAGGTSMVTGPDGREAVFVRCLADEVVVRVPPGDGIDVEEIGVSMRKGEVWAVRWEGVREAWEGGELELL